MTTQSTPPFHGRAPLLPALNLLTWPMASASQALRAACAAYATVLVAALATGAWTLTDVPVRGIPQGGEWVAAAVLSAFGIWRARTSLHGLPTRRSVSAVWPFAAIAVLGLFTHPVFAVLFAIGLFEIAQARYVLHLAPLKD